jgi:hypothetical protein
MILQQIRAQLGKLDLCVVGDEMYPRMIPVSEELGRGGRMGLQASRLEVACWGEKGFQGLGSKGATKKRSKKVCLLLIFLSSACLEHVTSIMLFVTVWDVGACT